MTTRTALCALTTVLLGCTTPWAPWPAPAAEAAGSGGDAAVRVLTTRDLVGGAGRELLLLSVDYKPGGTSLPHRHNAQVIVYVLEGSVRMQIEGAAPVTLKAGDTFYEGPEDVHAVSANASPSAPARLLVFMVKDKSAPASVPATAGAAPTGAAVAAGPR